MKTQKFFFVPGLWKGRKHFFFIIESLWLSDRASESRIRSSEVWFLVETQKFFFVPSLWKDRKQFFFILYQAQNWPFLLFYFHWTSWPVRAHRGYETLCAGQWIYLTSKASKEVTSKHLPKTQKRNSFPELNLIINSLKSHHHLEECSLSQNMSHYGLLMKIPW